MSPVTGNLPNMSHTTRRAALALALGGALALTGCFPLTATPPAERPSTQPVEETPEEPTTEEPDGTRSNPYPMGSELSGGDWEFVINSFNPDVNSEIANANMFNDPPEDGHTYAAVNITATYTGEDSSTTSFIDVDYVTAGGNVIKTYDHSVVGFDELGHQELFTGASATGNYIFHIPTPADGLIRIETLTTHAAFIALT